MLVLLAVGFGMLLEECRVRSNWARVGGGCNLTLWSSTSPRQSLSLSKDGLETAVSDLSLSRCTPVQ